MASNACMDAVSDRTTTVTGRHGRNLLFKCTSINCFDDVLLSSWGLHNACCCQYTFYQVRQNWVLSQNIGPRGSLFVLQQTDTPDFVHQVARIRDLYAYSSTCKTARYYDLQQNYLQKHKHVAAAVKSTSVFWLKLDIKEVVYASTLRISALLLCSPPAKRATHFNMACQAAGAVPWGYARHVLPVDIVSLRERS